MSILPRLFELYRQQGFSIISGLTPSHWGGLPSVTFTWLLQDGKNKTNGLGIALQEVCFLECLFSAYHPKRLFIIGNSFGWSAVAIALANPQARLVAMDAGFDPFSSDGLALTNTLARNAGVDLEAVLGVSPQDNEAVLTRCFDAPIDFAFIDGLHTNQQIVLDFQSVRQHASPDAVYVFHDVHAFGLDQGIAEIAAASGLTMRKLMATPSGIVVAYPPSMSETLAPVLAVFAPSDDVLAFVTTEAWRYKHPTLARWQRSLHKRRDRLGRLLGRKAPQ